jgi:hypothetical protein
MATQTVASWNQIIVCLLEVNLLREAAPRIADTPFARAAQPVGFALS